MAEGLVVFTLIAFHTGSLPPLDPDNSTKTRRIV
jgi:hypothetical protein